VSSRIALVRAPNPSPMTLSGTNSYVIDCGGGEAICIDPGPLIAAHVEALLARCDRIGKLSWICLTHGHPDHAPAAAALHERTGAPVAAHERSGVPRNRTLGDGDTVVAGEIALQTVESPGHSADHVVFYESGEGALFTGDVVLGEGYVAVLPPEGDMHAYMRTLERLIASFADARTIYGGHGDPVADPAAKLRDYLEHRRSREAQIAAALARGEQTVAQLVQTVYASTDRKLWDAAAEQMRAHLIALERDGRVESRGGTYRLR
jgi:glyoxylase-like metal-dependent hydrolase (beta-lactamase superfamily II)